MRRSLVILITGVNGYIGSNLYLNLSKKYKNIFGIGRINKGQTKYPKCINKNITIKNLEKLKLIPDIIIHCAGSGSVKKSNFNPRKDYLDNVNTTKNIISYCEKNKKKIHIIYTSSAAIFGDRKSNKEVFKPISIYGKNKLLAEKIITKSNSKKITYSILRIYSIFGIGLKKQLIWDVCNKVKKNRFSYYGTGNEKRSWVSIDKLVQYILKIIKNKKKNHIEEVSGNFSISNVKLINYIHKLMKFHKKPNFNLKTRKGDPVNLVPFSYVKRNKLKFNKSNFLNELKNYVAWFNENY